MILRPNTRRSTTSALAAGLGRDRQQSSPGLLAATAGLNALVAAAAPATAAAAAAAATPTAAGAVAGCVLLPAVLQDMLLLPSGSFGAATLHE